MSRTIVNIFSISLMSASYSRNAPKVHGVLPGRFLNGTTEGAGPNLAYFARKSSASYPPFFLLSLGYGDVQFRCFGVGLTLKQIPLPCKGLSDLEVRLGTAYPLLLFREKVHCFLAAAGPIVEIDLKFRNVANEFSAIDNSQAPRRLPGLIRPPFAHITKFNILEPQRVGIAPIVLHAQ